MGNDLPRNPWQKSENVFDSPPYVHEKDVDRFLKENQRSWKDSSKRNNGLWPQLLPLPFIGDIQNAEVFLLQANPGVELASFAAVPVNQQVQEIKSLKQETIRCNQQSYDEPLEIEYPFYFLNPSNWWSGGSSWWRNTLEEIIWHVGEKEHEEWGEPEKFPSPPIERSAMIQSGGFSLNEEVKKIYRMVAERICAVELHGYRSRNYRTPRKWFPTSAFNARIVERALKMDKLIIVMKSYDDWNDLLVKECKNFGKTDDPLRDHDGQVITLSSNQNSKLTNNNLEGTHPINEIGRVIRE